jgi:transcriptional regulator with XRE-family HTH domain
MSKQKQTKRAVILQERRIFAINLKQAREDAGFTQNDISKITGMTQSFLSKVENARNNISLDNMIVLSDAIGKPLSLLLTPPKNK